MTEDNKALTTLDVAKDIAARGPDDKVIEEWLLGLPKEEFRIRLVRSRPLAKALAAIARVGKKRNVTEFALGEVWKDPDTGVEYIWGRGQSDDWKVEDPLGLRIGLAKIVRKDGSRLFTDEECKRAVPDKPVPDHKVLTEFAARSDEARELIDDFREKPETAPDLREKGAK